ncbi:hypothetical protein KI387_043265, partial [Taxus chinensis]
ISEIPSQNNQSIDIDEANIPSLDEIAVQENSSNSLNTDTPTEEASTLRSISRKRRHEIPNISAESPDAEAESQGKKENMSEERWKTRQLEGNSSSNGLQNILLLNLCTLKIQMMFQHNVATKYVVGNR